MPRGKSTMNELSDDERHAMVLCHAFGLSHGEASEVTGMPLGTVKSHIKNIYYKLQVNSKADAIEKALKEKLI